MRWTIFYLDELNVVFLKNYVITNTYNINRENFLTRLLCISISTQYSQFSSNYNL